MAKANGHEVRALVLALEVPGRFDGEAEARIIFLVPQHEHDGHAGILRLVESEIDEFGAYALFLEFRIDAHRPEPEPAELLEHAYREEHDVADDLPLPLRHEFEPDLLLLLQP